MGLFDITDDKLRNLYHRAWLEANRGSWKQESILISIKLFSSMQRNMVVPLTKL